MARKIHLLSAVAVVPTAVIASSSFWTAPFPHPTILRRSEGESSCDTVAEIVKVCTAAIPDYAQSTDKELAGCLCCDSGSWNTAHFDQPVSSCLSYLSENVPQQTQLINAYGNIAGFCSVIGSVSCLAGSITATPTAVATANAGQMTGSVGCSSALSMVDSCSSTIPDMDDTTYEEVGACLCYDGTKWIPDKFDGYIDSCLSWATTGFPQYYSSISNLDNFCSIIGPLTVKGGTPTITATTSFSTSTDDLGGNSITELGASSTRTVVLTPTSTDAASNLSPVAALPMTGGIAGFVMWIIRLYILL